MMSPTLFIITVSFYLISFVSTIILSFFTGFISHRLVRMIMIIHLLNLLVYFIFRSEDHTLQDPGFSNYLFLSFFCSGLLVSGVVLRMKFTIIVKAYFSIFLLSLVLFITSPSRLLGFIASGSPRAFNPERLHISENYFFVEQGSLEEMDASSGTFKIVREMGMFHKTLARNVVLPAETDSVKLLEMSEGEFIFVRIYTQKGTRTDSLDYKFPLVIERDSTHIITRKLNY